MSREIKFRGQTRRKGERIINMAGDKCEANWVYGGIFPQNNGGDFAIIYEQSSCEKRVAYADTVGQYIGVSDKNGKEIYEGDIVKHDVSDTIGVVKWYHEDYIGWCVDDIQIGEQQFTDEIWNECEVIGNVYENADLLENTDLLKEVWNK